MWAVPAGDEVYVYLMDVTDRARAMQSDAVRQSLRQVLMDAPVRNALPEVDPSLFAMLDRGFERGEPLTLRDLEVTYDRDGDGALYTGTVDVTYQPLWESDGTVSGIISTAVETTSYSAARRSVDG